jgi:lysophospholipase L1-like esterase
VRQTGSVGEHQVEIPDYEANLAQIVHALRARGAAVVFATTTPVDDARHAATEKPTRLDADVRRYNEAARRVMETLEVPVVDLYPLGQDMLAADGVHLTAEGKTVLAAAVAGVVADLL